MKKLTFLKTLIIISTFAFVNCSNKSAESNSENAPKGTSEPFSINVQASNRPDQTIRGIITRTHVTTFVQVEIPQDSGDCLYGSILLENNTDGLPRVNQESPSAILIREEGYRERSINGTASFQLSGAIHLKKDGLLKTNCSMTQNQSATVNADEAYTYMKTNIKSTSQMIDVPNAKIPFKYAWCTMSISVKATERMRVFLNGESNEITGFSLKVSNYTNEFRETMRILKAYPAEATPADKLHRDACPQLEWQFNVRRQDRFHSYYRKGLRESEQERAQLLEELLKTLP